MNILVVDAWLPTPDRDAASLQMSNLLQLLQEFGRVTFGADDFAARRSGLPGVQDLDVNLILPPASIKEHLAAHADLYDAIFLSRAQVADKYFDAARAANPRAGILFDTTDLAYVRGFRGAQVLNNMNLLRRALEMKQTELGVMRKADMTLVVSPAEQQMLAQDCPAARVRIVTLIHNTFPVTTSFHERAGILFVGAFPHLPNADAMRFFYDDILPLVRERLGNVTVTVVGSHPSEWLQQLHSENFVVAHHVIDLAPLLHHCRVTIAPLRYGAGVKGKVLTSMSYGVPVVGTTIAAEGIPVAHRQEMMIADEPNAFADALGQVYMDETLWNTLSANGARVVEQNYSRAVARQTLTAIFDELGLR